VLVVIALLVHATSANWKLALPSFLWFFCIRMLWLRRVRWRANVRLALKISRELFVSFWALHHIASQTLRNMKTLKGPAPLLGAGGVSNARP
jgi:hypothetical protein